MGKNSITFNLVSCFALVFVAVVFFIAFDNFAGSVLNNVFGVFGNFLFQFLRLVFLLGIVWALIKLFVTDML